MKAIVFDPFCGASGDMIIGSLLDIGADHDKVKSAMENVDDGIKNVRIESVKKSGISATKVDVICDDKGHRMLKDVVKIVEDSGLDDAVIEDSKAIFEKIAEAESKVHDVTIDKLIFHEVGAADAIADVVGSSVAFHDLGVKNHSVYCTPISTGGGFVECSHGRLPVPAPATLEILSNSGLKSKGGPIDKELLSPTGAAILSHFVEVCDDFFPQMKIEKVGYGAGSYDLTIPNVLRTVLGEVDDALQRDEIEVLETNVDDVTGEILGELIDQLIKLGAKDVAVVPATMKKGRSGYIIKVITKSIDTPIIIRKIIEETGSLGVRVMPIKHRLIAQREITSVTIDIGGVEKEVMVKIATDTKDRLLNISAEFDDAKRVARELNLPVREIIRRAEEVARREFL
ncbi:MAG: nickel pincer cofactor biosynthesis protein LarC [Halobacteriota archaeon]|nr:nickel pincer cofactor biosynthesis protein LarC [Halobacteriota archaeon]